VASGEAVSDTSTALEQQAGREPSRPPLRLPRWLDGWALLAVPGIAFLAVFFVVPMGLMLARSFTDPSPENYVVFVQSPLYVRVLMNTFWTAFLVTVVCLLAGYTYAYAMYRAGRWLAPLLIILVIFPFWSSFLVRSYAWMVLLQDSGLINNALVAIGLVERPLQLMRNTLGVSIGMTHIFLPFMVLPIYAAMRRMDPDLPLAASSLGARPRAAFWRVFFPLTLPGVYAGCLLVFVPALGFFITPALLGSPRNQMFSELIVLQVSSLLRFGVGSALAVILLVTTLVLVWVGTRVVNVREFLGGQAE
jgi:putative spermidine/putrescine transport system permease protein